MKYSPWGRNSFRMENFPNGGNKFMFDYFPIFLIENIACSSSSPGVLKGLRLKRVFLISSSFGMLIKNWWVEELREGKLVEMRVDKSI